MSYHGREWDRGKDWGAGSSRVNFREREGDDGHGGDWKRRKYNNGDYNDGHSLQYDDGQIGYGYNEYSTGQPNEERAKGPQNRKRHVASEPSPHVIFLGLDTDFTEADLSGYLQAQGCVLENVTIIRDRNTGQSKGFGFAQFKTIESARSFVDPNFPFISVPPPVSHGASALAAYNQAMASGAHQGTRRVKIDYSQSANPPGRGRGPQFSNDGTRDIGNTQASVLLFRGLDPLSGPAAVAQAMKTSSGLGKDGAKGMKRVLLVKDRATLASWGFAFVEFIDVQSASAVLACTMSTSLHPNGFRISDRPVAASFAHPYSFQILPEHTIPDDACVESSVALGGADGMWCRYWDEQSTLAVLSFNTIESTKAPLQEKEKEKEKKENKKTKGLSSEGQMAIGASTLPVSDKPVTLNFSKSVIGSGKTGALAPASKLPVGFTASEDVKAALGGDESDELAVATGDKAAKSAQRVPPLIASKKVVKNITKWQQVQEELSSTSIPKPLNTPSPLTTVLESEPHKNNEEELMFSDTKNMICLLCARQFKAIDQLKRHNRDSDLHKKNSADKALCDVAKDKKDKLQHQQAPQEHTVKYRDRASERRILHNQPDAPVLESKPSNKRHAEGPPPPPSPPPPPTAPGRDSNNIGNKLLKLMGWSEGTGLGSEGEGRVEPIETAIYASGAGLGASKGKEIGKYTEGYTGYVHMVKDAARERYGQQ